MFNSIKTSIDNISINGPIIGMGVHKGNTLKQIRSYSDKEIHAFDSWVGLPEDWIDKNGRIVGKGKKGRFNTGGLPPNIEGVNFWGGFFEDTLPKFAESFKGNISFLNVDCDLYSSTKTVFDNFKPFLRKGTVIRFDEWFYKHSLQHKEGEQKAFLEFCEDHNIYYRQLYYEIFEKQDEESTVLILG